MKTVIEHCPTCGRPLPHIRLGVNLTPLKARIYDLIHRSGDIGISSRDIHNIIYADLRGTRHLRTIKAHCQQINERLDITNFKLISKNRTWFLAKRR